MLNPSHTTAATSVLVLASMVSAMAKSAVEGTLGPVREK
jgi:hypothetical protein